jgi:hypothetical protein
MCQRASQASLVIRTIFMSESDGGIAYLYAEYAYNVSVLIIATEHETYVANATNGARNPREGC